MDEPNRSVAKRQIARLLGGSSNPMYVLSEDDTVVFANDALARLLDRSPDSLLGMQCSSPLPADETPDASIISLLAAPVDWSRQQLKLIPWQHPNSAKSDNNQALIQCFVPLDTPERGCTLSIICPASSLQENSWIDVSSGVVQRALGDSREQFARLDSLWFLQGTSLHSRRALEQSQIAFQSNASLSIIGPPGSGRTCLAKIVHARRLSQSTDLQAANSLVHIECALMDGDLLKSMFEMLSESRSEGASQRTLLLDGLESLPSECYPMLASYLQRHENYPCIATYAPPTEVQVTHHASWQQIVVRTSTLRVELPTLADRLEDMRVLVVAYLNAHRQQEKNLEFSASFLDSLAAYSWPNDIEEFSEAMEYAIANLSKEGEGYLLEDRHLPVNIRTCVSHIEHEQTDHSVDLDAILEDVEKTMILRAIERFPNNKTSAAKLLNISRARLLRRLQQWGIHVESSTADGDDDQPIFKEVP